MLVANVGGRTDPHYTTAQASSSPARTTRTTPFPSNSSSPAARRPTPPYSAASGAAFQAHEASDEANTSSYTPMAAPRSLDLAPITTTTTFGTGAYGPSADFAREPPRHSRPLYHHIPLPDDHVQLHPALDYEADVEWHTPRSSAGLHNHNWSAPATSPGLASLTIVLSSTGQRITIYPSSPPTSPQRGVVTVRDVLVAVDGAMHHLNTTDDGCRQHVPAVSRSNQERGIMRKCSCKEVASLEYLRQMYGRAGLRKVGQDDRVWVLHIGWR
jgi:hypothetical protein